jgi:hypothetical protein
MVAIPFSEGCVFVQGPWRGSRIESKKVGRSRRGRKYGISPNEYDRLLLKQDGRCAICKRLPYTKKGLVVDHCHETGIISGILCSRCNSALGLLDDSPLLLERALEYLT